MNSRVLLAEDDLPANNFLTKALQSNGIDVVSTNNGQDAWNEFQKQTFSVVLTDLDMPFVRGEELIDRIQKADLKVPPVIIVITSLHDSKHIIEIMKKGVFDYLIKPADAAQIILKVKHASKSYELQKINYVLASEKELRLTEQLDWIKYKNNISDKNIGNYKNNIVQSMRHNLGQTGGFGNLMALLEIVQIDAKEEGDNYIISKEIYNLLKENIGIIDKTFVVLENITKISESKLNLDQVSAKDIFELTRSIVNESETFAKINSQTMIMGEIRDSYSDHYIKFHKESYRQLMNEVYLNAFKFSEKESKIFTLFRIQDRKLVVSIIIDPAKYIDVVGIPLEYSNLVFEPFFRINKFVFEKFSSMDIGLGLTLVKELIKKMEGDVSISNIKEFTVLDSNKIKVNLEIYFPLI
ncbi:MAG: response regulator [Leptospira sp.]|nr:response regulator [Leptospira sp.]